MEVKFELGGLGFLVSIILIILKLTGTLDISWLICLLPIIVSVGIVVLLMIIMLLYSIIKMHKIEKDEK